MTSVGPRRFIPDDADFTRSIQLMEDDACDMRSLRAAALATLPTPVAAEECYRMWIPAPEVVDSHNIDEILQSLAGSQVQIWKDARPQVRDFVRIPKHGISFVCTSLATCHTLGGLSLKICGSPVKIRKYSRYDKWYYVDLTRLPLDILDSDIYDWFCNEGARPVLITPKYQASGLTSRDRTVFFPQVSCPNALFVDEKTPVREIFFTDEQASPCFVYHRTRSLNKFTPPSLKKVPKPKRHIDLSENESDKSDGAPEESNNDDNEPTSEDAPMEGEEEPADSAAQSTASDASQRSIIISRVDAATLSEWKLVNNSKHGLIAADPVPEPTSLTPCELVDEGDEHSLKYSLATTPNYYRVLVHEYLDDATSPDVDIEVKSAEGSILNGYTADSTLLPLSDARKLTNARHHKHKVEHMSLAELTSAIDAYLMKDFAGLLSNNHEDALAAVKAQPAYHRRIFSLKDDEQLALVQQHAVYRALMSTQHENSAFSLQKRIEHKYGQEPPPMSTIFTQIFATAPEQESAYSYALMDLLLMIMAPSIYLDPVKVQILLPPQLQPRRLRYSPFLLWSDITLVYMAQTDVCATFLKHLKIPLQVKSAIEVVKAALPTSLADVKTSRCCHPRL